MPTAFRVVDGGSAGGGDAAATPAYDEGIGVSDAALMGRVANEPMVMRDAFTMQRTGDEPLHLVDTYTLTSERSTNDAFKLDDAGTVPIVDLVVGRSGTPNTDQMSDAWVDQAAASSNHGNESIQVKGVSTAPGSDAKRGLLQIDLTRVTGFTAGAAGGSLVLEISLSGLVATNMLVSYATQATAWFTESTVTWNTRPGGTPVALPSQSVSPGGPATYTVTLSQADVNAMLGKWVLFIFQGNSAAVPPTFTILSRDNATASNRPKFTAALSVT